MNGKEVTKAVPDDELRATTPGVIGRVGQAIDDHFAAGLAVLLSLWLVLFIPQVRNILFHLPSFEEVAWPLALGFYLFVAAIIVVDCLLLVGLVPRWDTSEQSDEFEQQAFRRSRLLDAPLQCVPALGALLQRTLGVALVVGASLITIRASETATLLATCATAAGGLGLLLAFTPPGTRALASFHSVLVWRAWASAVFSLGIGITIWSLIPLVPVWLSYRNYTIWALLELVFLAILVARVVDAATRQSRLNLRLFFIVAVAVLLGTEGAQTIGARFDPDSRGATGQASQDASALGWAERLSARLDKLPRGPAIIVTASGGGSRAALYTSLILEALAKTQVLPPDDTQPDRPSSIESTFADNLLIISSVSGGSLASSWFATRYPQPDRSELQHTTERELAVHILRQAKRFRDGAIPESEAEERMLQDIYADCEALLAWVDGVGQAPRLPTSFRSAFADDMCIDYMAPVLRGVLSPSIDRGTSLSNFWESQFEWSGLSNQSWDADDKPFLLLNAAYAQRGQRFIIGFPPLPASGMGDGVLRLNSFGPYELTLASSVRISAGFPWLMPIARLDVPPIPGTEGAYKEQMHLVDGAIVDNTGIDSVATVFLGLGQLAWGKPGDGTPIASRIAARRVMSQLRRRGVILLEIDSGAKKRSLSGVSNMLPSLFEPVEALQVALDANAWHSIKRHVAQLERALPTRLLYDALTFFGDASDVDQTQPEFTGSSALIHLTLSCDRFDDVMTAWALGPKEKAIVWTTFLFEFGLTLPSLRDAFWSHFELGNWLHKIESNGEALDASELAEQSAADQALETLKTRIQNLESFRARLREGVANQRKPLRANTDHVPARRLQMQAVMPNPMGNDRVGEEGVYVENTGSETVSLAAWTIGVVGESKVWQLDATDGVLSAGERRRIQRRGREPELPDDGAELRLTAPDGEVHDRGTYGWEVPGRVLLLKR
ncbi:MAG: hypothetical protein ACI841_000319 [Planctomycetota bacterium]|jgi:hypothetical protein